MCSVGVNTDMFAHVLMFWCAARIRTAGLCSLFVHMHVKLRRSLPQYKAVCLGISLMCCRGISLQLYPLL